MPDILIRDVPSGAADALTERASASGMVRQEWLRQHFTAIPITSMERQPIWPVMLPTKAARATPTQSNSMVRVRMREVVVWPTEATIAGPPTMETLRQHVHLLLRLLAR